ncbi:amino acid adenylation [Thozetella sp. PMI_491]|nr:amino acid adenylation [Thozetella sp. PMI_491]
MTELSSESLKKIQEWNRNVPTAVQTLVQHLIGAKAEEQPAAQALCSWDGDLSFAELDDYSSRLATHLISMGVTLGNVVPICFEKSIWAVVSLLAILKAGAVWTPLDISLPEARLSTIVAQTDAKFALSSATGLLKCTSLFLNTLVVDRPTILAMDRGTPDLRISPADAGYIIFTSGSTGVPKGVVIEHSQLSSMAVYCGAGLGYSREARVLQFSSYAFDACVSDIFATLVHGGCVCIPGESERNDALVQAMQRMRVTHVLVTPSLWGSLDVRDVPTLTTLTLGGEAAPASLVQEWSRRVRVMLAYGPTECTVLCYIADLRDYEAVSSMIGRPVGARGWIVMEGNCDKLAEVGEAGELLVEGPLVGRGYLNDLEKTERCFIHAPAWMQAFTESGATSRLYRTGDLVRYLDDGRVCYMGRIDKQVKVRGYRIELEEIETQLSRGLAAIDGVEVQQVVVEAVTFPSLMTRHLVAFIWFPDTQHFGFLEWEPEDGPALVTVTREREAFAAVVSKAVEALKLVLPSYAVPSIYIPLRTAPFTLSKKMDRSRLRAAASAFSAKQLSIFATPPVPLTPPDSRSSSTPAELTESEKVLWSLWADIFCIPSGTIEREDNFFSSGGDSVLAIKLVSAARVKGLDLTFDMVFKHPALCDMAQAATLVTISQQEYAPIPPYALLDNQDAAVVRQQAAEQCGIDPRQIEDMYPCSSMQSALYALSMKEPGAYILRFVYPLSSDVDLVKLKNAWGAVVARSPILRTRFIQGNTTLIQVVVDGQIQWRTLDQSLDDFLVAEAERGVEIGQEMSSFYILPSGNTAQNHLVWTVHHSLVDAWCTAGIVAAVEQEYLGTPWTRSDPPFKAYIKYIREQDEDAAREFWKTQLAEAPAQSFPTLPETGHKSHAKSIIQKDIPTVTREGVTVATIIQTAWVALVGALTNSSDVVVGITLNGRTAQLPGIDTILGPTLNTLPLRLRLDPNQTVSELLKRIQGQYLEMIPFQHFGLEKIRRLGSDINAACDFQSLLVVQSAIDPRVEMGPLTAKPSLVTSFSQALNIECELHQERITIRVTFDERVLSEARIRRIIDQLEAILRRISLAGPDTKVSELQQISDSDMTQILRWNNGGITPNPTRSCVHHLIEQRARQRKSAAAVCAWDGELSYQKLDQYSSLLAIELQNTYHVGPETLVPVCFEKSLWVVVAMLAVLKAGGACVPMEPSHPTARCKAILERLGHQCAKVVLTSVLHAGRVSEFGRPTIAIGPQMIHALNSQASLIDRATPSNAAFLVFTSGSTGTPKGIVLEHEAFCSSAMNHGPLLGIDEKTRAFQFAAHTFDVSLGDIFSPLIFGGCVCIPSEHDRMNNLSGAIVALQANHLLCTPQIASHLRPDDLPCLKTLLVGGELMLQEVFDTWVDRVNFLQLYGPAECTLYCVGTKVLNRHCRVNNIGKGFSGLAWIANPEDPNQLTPIGGVGELLLEGPVLARCYIGDDIQTKKAFIVDPDWSMSYGLRLGRRFYRTGDLVSYDSEGSLLFHGRNDGQVKLRGQRIEVAEVEARLRECLPSTVEVAVTLLHPQVGEKMLASYLTVEQGEQGDNDASLIVRSSIATSNLRTLIAGIKVKLRAALPSYMVPSVYVPIRSLPLSSSSKVDRKRLQDAASKLSWNELADMRLDNVDRARSEPPLTEMEKLLHAVWMVVLRTSHISATDSFFQLGGDSISCIRAVSMARKEGIRITVNDIFEAPTLRSLALRAGRYETAVDVEPFSLLETLETRNMIEEASRQCRIHLDAVEDIYPCSTMQQHYLVGYGTKDQKAPTDPVDWQLQLVFSLPASIDLQKFKEVWDTAVRRHAPLRTRVINTPDGIFQVVVKPGLQSEWIESSSLDEYLRMDEANHMGYGTELLRLAIISPTDMAGSHFVMTAFHCIHDGFAMNLLFKEIEAAYVQGYPTSKPPKMSQFIKHMITADRATATNFWAVHLGNATTKPLLNAPRGSYPVLDMMEKCKITEAPKIHPWDVTLSTMIEVAGCLAISHQLKCPDVILCSDRTGRNLPVDGIQDLIGPTTLYLPIRVHVDSGEKVRDLLQNAQAFQRAMVPFEHVGWLEMNRISELEPALRCSVNMNVNPHPMEALGKGLGLDLEAANGVSDDPFLIDVYVRPDGQIEWKIFYDLRLISQERVDTLLEDMTTVFSHLVDSPSNSELLVGDILSQL